MWFLIAIMKRAQNECALLKYFYSFSAAQLNNIESENEVLFRNFHAKRMIMEIAMMKISSRLNSNYYFECSFKN